MSDNNGNGSQVNSNGQDKYQFDQWVFTGLAVLCFSLFLKVDDDFKVKFWMVETAQATLLLASLVSVLFVMIIFQERTRPDNRRITWVHNLLLIAAGFLAIFGIGLFLGLVNLFYLQIYGVFVFVGFVSVALYASFCRSVEDDGSHGGDAG